MTVLIPMKGTKKPCDNYECLMTVLKRYKLELANLSAVVTDGAPSTVGVVCMLQNKKITILSYINEIIAEYEV